MTTTLVVNDIVQGVLGIVQVVTTHLFFDIAVVAIITVRSLFHRHHRV